MHKELTIKRKKSLIGALISFPVLIDGKEIGLLKNNKSLTYSILPGKHTIIFKAVEKDIKEEIDVSENIKSVEINTTTKMGLITATIKIESVKYR